MEGSRRWTYVRVGALGEIPEGEARAYDTPAGRVAVPTIETHLYAFADECTAQGCSLAEGEFDDRRATIECAVRRQRVRRRDRRAGRGPGARSARRVRRSRGRRLGRGRHQGRRALAPPHSSVGSRPDRRARRDRDDRRRTRFDLQPDQIPTAWFNIMPDMVKAGMQPLPPLQPADEGADRARGPRAAVPRVADHAGGLHRPVDRHPGRGDRHLPAVEADAVVPGHAAGAGARHARAHLLQVRGRLAGREPQAEHRGAAGVLQQGGGHPPHRHRDRRRAMGLGDGDGVQHVRPRMRRLHGEGLVRAEAVPAGVHGDVRRERGRLARATRPTAAARSSRRTPTPPGRSASRSARRSRTPRRTTTRTTRSGACWATCCCTSR